MAGSSQVCRTQKIVTCYIGGGGCFASCEQSTVKACMAGDDLDNSSVNSLALTLCTGLIEHQTVLIMSMTSILVLL